MVVFLLIIIAVGVLLISEPGKELLRFFFVWGIRLSIVVILIGIFGMALIVTYVYFKNDNQAAPVSNQSQTINPPQITNDKQKPESQDDLFPMKEANCIQGDCNQYTWYDRHNVPMAYRCYPGDCSAQQWALAIYANPKDTRGVDLKKQSDSVYAESRARFRTEKCVVEHDTKICDLQYSSAQIYDLPSYRNVTAEGNSVSCIDMGTIDVITNDVSRIRAKKNNSFCVSDLGYVYIDPNIKVAKHWGLIEKAGNNSPYKIQKSYDTCVWTWADGSGNIPYMELLGNVGPRSGYSVRAFCKNGDNQIDIYSFES